VANSTAKYITLVDPVTLEVLGKIETANSSYDLVFGADGKLLYTVGPYARVINILDVEKREIVGTIEGLDGGPIRIEISPDGETLYVLAKNAKKRIGLVVFASTSKREIEAQVTVDSTPQGLALHPNGKLLFATSFKLNTASVIDTATREIVSKWDVETGEGLSVHPTKPVLYSTGSFDGDIHVLNYETGELIEVLSLGDYPTYSDLSPDGRYLFVPHEDSSLVAQIDTETNERVARIAVGREPVEVRYFELP
jgi:YVTN family beta-propeller protein